MSRSRPGWALWPFVSSGARVFVWTAVAYLVSEDFMV
jgi:hypothetical protein